MYLSLLVPIYYILQRREICSRKGMEVLNFLLGALLQLKKVRYMYVYIDVYDKSTPTCVSKVSKKFLFIQNAQSVLSTAHAVM